MKYANDHHNIVFIRATIDPTHRSDRLIRSVPMTDFGLEIDIPVVTVHMDPNDYPGYPAVFYSRSGRLDCGN